ncbi:putative cysteine-rich receptor-like protein kinase 30 [Bienertia sinuspersici]
MEISLAIKRKLGFVTRATKKDRKDAQKAERWETYDSMLEKTFNVANRSRKYKVAKDLMDTQQNGGSICEYYTIMKRLWEEEDAMNMLPPIINPNHEIDAFIRALNTQKEENRLFQFLNGVDEDYAGMRTQMLMKSPLPIVKEACASIQQEEIQNEVLKMSKLNIESNAMVTQKKSETGCSA